MIIDCHGHYTTIPAAFGEYRDALHARLAEADGGALPAVPAISDGEISEMIEANQLRLQGERGIDLTIFSPRASWMDQHITDAATARAWARASNDLVHRVTTLSRGTSPASASCRRLRVARSAIRSPSLSGA